MTPEILSGEMQNSEECKQYRKEAIDAAVHETLSDRKQPGVTVR